MTTVTSHEIIRLRTHEPWSGRSQSRSRHMSCGAPQPAWRWPGFVLRWAGAAAPPSPPRAAPPRPSAAESSPSFSALPRLSGWLRANGGRERKDCKIYTHRWTQTWLRKKPALFFIFTWAEKQKCWLIAGDKWAGWGGWGWGRAITDTGTPSKQPWVFTAFKGFTVPYMCFRLWWQLCQCSAGWVVWGGGVAAAAGVGCYSPEEENGRERVHMETPAAPNNRTHCLCSVPSLLFQPLN